jgi:hypothetical protein
MNKTWTTSPKYYRMFLYEPNMDPHWVEIWSRREQNERRDCCCMVIDAVE